MSNPGINIQIIVFAVTSVLSLLALRKMIQKRFFYSKPGLSESVEDEFTGKEALAVMDFEPGKNGKVDFKGTTWKAESKSSINEGEIVIIKAERKF